MPINYFNGIGRLSALNVVLNDISLHTNQMLSQPVDLIKIIISAIYYRSERLYFSRGVGLESFFPRGTKFQKLI